MAPLMSTGHCVAIYKRVGILPPSFACRTRAQEEEYHPRNRRDGIQEDLSLAYFRVGPLDGFEVLFMFRPTAVVVGHQRKSGDPL